MFRPSDKIRRASRGSAETAIAAIKARGGKGDYAAFVRAVYRLAPALGIDAGFVIGQAIWETNWFTSLFWTRDGNPGGIGIDGDDNGNHTDESPFTKLTGEQAAIVHLAVLFLKLDGTGTVLPASLKAAEAVAGTYLTKTLKMTTDGNWPPVTTIGDLCLRFRSTVTGNTEATWAWDAGYATGICDRLNASVFPGLPDDAGGGVVTYSTIIPGLPGGPLVTTYPIYLKLIPEWRTNNRPGYEARLPRRSVQHGNGNPNSSAAGEATYLYGGAGGRQASYHAAGDDKEIWVMVPADEVTWQAADGNGPGNYNGYSMEMVEDAALWANPARRTRVIAICADFMGRVAGARLGATKPEQHWDFNYSNAPTARHDCPNKLRHVSIDGRLAWDRYGELWAAARADERVRMAGEQPEPKPAPAPKPVLAKLPKGMSSGVAEALFNPTGMKRPDGRSASFNLKGGLSQWWLTQGLASIPAGGDWTQGQWPGLTQIVKRGDGRLIWQFGSWIYQEDPA